MTAIERLAAALERAIMWLALNRRSMRDYILATEAEARAQADASLLALREAARAIVDVVNERHGQRVETPHRYEVPWREMVGLMTVLSDSAQAAQDARVAIEDAHLAHLNACEDCRKAVLDRYLRSPDAERALAEALIAPLDKRGVNFQGPPPEQGRDVDAVAREALAAWREALR